MRVSRYDYENYQPCWHLRQVAFRLIRLSSSRKKVMLTFIKRLFSLLLLVPLFAFAQTDIRAELGKLSWVNGPAKGEIGTKANIQIPKDYVFLGERDTRRFIELPDRPEIA